MLAPMSAKPDAGVYIGTDSGATMSKVGGVWADGRTISTRLSQRPTNFQQGPPAGPKRRLGAGDTLGGMETAHMPSALRLRGAKGYPCGCGGTWGCVGVYRTRAGLPHLLAERLPSSPDHPLATSTAAPKEKAMSLRGLAQKD